jgi:dethiobiotin synthetase
MRLSGYFVTGTDTGVGKTRVTCALAAELRARGRRVIAAKPIESGGGGDADSIARAAGHPPICLYRFGPPIAPGVAAEAEGVAIDFDAIFRALAEYTLGPHAQRGAGRDVTMLVEGAGGLLCPLGGLQTMADLAARLGLPLLIVARSGLGTINHTLLTLTEARRRGLEVAGIILSEVSSERTPDEPANPAWIERLGDVRILGRLRHGAERLDLATQSIVGQ